MDVELIDNEFLRHFEINIKGTIATVEYTKQERKIFLTKLNIPKEIYSKDIEKSFIQKVLDTLSKTKNPNGRRPEVVPVCPKITDFFRKNIDYKELLPVGIQV